MNKTSLGSEDNNDEKLMLLKQELHAQNKFIRP